MLNIDKIIKPYRDRWYWIDPYKLHHPLIIQHLQDFNKEPLLPEYQDKK